MDIEQVKSNRIADRWALNLREIALKAYRFASFTEEMDPEGYLGLNARRLYVEILKHGNIGHAFLYAYEGDNGIVKGMDLAVYENAEKASRSGYVRLPVNPILHTWTIEDDRKKEFQILDRSDDATRCTIEDVISGRESEQVLMYLWENGPEMDINDYMNSWPHLGSLHSLLIEQAVKPSDMPYLERAQSKVF